MQSIGLEEIARSVEIKDWRGLPASFRNCEVAENGEATLANKSQRLGHSSCVSSVHMPDLG